MKNYTIDYILYYESNILNNAFLIIILILFSSCSVSNKQDNLSQVISTERYIVYNDFPSKYISKRTIEVWLPNGYDDAEALPVLYMFDGQNIFHGKKAWFNNGYSHGWQVDETLDSLFEIGSVPRIMVVGIFNTGVERISEYMPAKPRKEVEKRIPKAQQWVKQGYEKYGITSDEFLKFLVKELKPFIDKEYKTDSRRESTYLAGSSMGGLISAYAICEYPNVFGGAACLSTHWIALDGVFIEYLKNNLPDPRFHKLYFDYGTLGLDSKYEPYQLIVDSLLTLKGYKPNVNSITKKFEGENHNEASWRVRFHYPIEFFFRTNK